MQDLRSPTLIKAKAILFLVTGALASALLLLERPSWKIAALLVVATWSFCRLYYFAFYVVERYLEPNQRASGILSAIRQRIARP